MTAFIIGIAATAILAYTFDKYVMTPLETRKSNQEKG